MVDGKRVVIMDKTFQNGPFRDTVKNAYMAASSGSLEHTQEWVAKRVYAQTAEFRAKQRRQHEIKALVK